MNYIKFLTGLFLVCLIGAPIYSIQAQDYTVPDSLQAGDVVVVRPNEIPDVLNNPGKGFTTFQRFNGDTLNRVGWTEGKPLVYQEFDGNLENKDYPRTSIAYFRIYWRYVEPKEGEYNWEMIDKAIKTAQERGQQLMLRIAPYGGGAVGNGKDVPSWYRNKVGNKNEWLPNPNGEDWRPYEGKGWRVDANDPRYAKYFGRMIRKLGQRYDGNPGLLSVDVSIVGFWGEGKGSYLLKEKPRKKIVNAYTDNFHKTPLVMLLIDTKATKYGLSKANVGWRQDCLGDMGGFSKTFNHMYDSYPRRIIESGMRDAWKKAPVEFEVCWTMQKWKDEGWDLDYIIDQSLKWHMSSFNAKSSPVPKEWQPAVDRWIKKMGYRFVLRRFSYPERVKPGGKLRFTSWWENKGVAPIYQKYPLALRLQGVQGQESIVLLTGADVRKWMPGDNLYDGAVFIPRDLPKGDYELQLGLIKPLQQLDKSSQPAVDLAIDGRTDEGWYKLGKLTVGKK